MQAELLTALANVRNQRILELLAVEPSYPRRVAALLGVSETEVARRLRSLERVGLVSAAWERQTSNVRVYRLAVGTVQVTVTPGGIQATTAAGPAPRPMEGARHLTVPPPPAPAAFVGRTTELEALARADPVALVVGIAGTGKTALAARHAESEQRPVFWRTFVGVESLLWLANHLGMFLAEHGRPQLLHDLAPGIEPADAADAIRRALEEADVTIVLDGVESVRDEGLQTYIANLLRWRPRGKLIVTSRAWIPCDPTAPGLTVLRLAGLDPDAAMRFLGGQGVAVPPTHVELLRREYGGHPLSLALLAQAAHVRPIEALLDSAPEGDLSDWLLREVDGDLDDDERMALAHASIFAAPFTVHDLAAVAKRRVDGAVARLRKRLLVQEGQAGLTVHEIVRTYFQTRLDRPAEVHLRAAEHALAKGTVEARLEAFHHFHKAGRHDRVLKLVEDDLELHAFDFVGAGYQRLYLDTLESIRRDEVASGRHWALILDERGDLYLHARRAAEAAQAYEASAQAFAACGDKARQAKALEKAALAQARVSALAQV